MIRVTKLDQFCSIDDLSCMIYLDSFENSWFATGDEDFTNDSFGFTLYYLSGEGERIYLYESTNGGLFARPKLMPLSIEISRVML